MNKGGHPGFTIVEAMIVLAVTGALFVAIAGTFSGRQNEAEFIHAIQTAQFKIQQVINQVSTGFYPNVVSCTVSGGSISFGPPSAQGQGTNAGCVFLGKVIQFQIIGTGGSTNTPEQYGVYSVAGLQCSTIAVGSCGAGTASQPFHNAGALVVSANAPNYTDSDVTDSGSIGAWEYGLTTQAMYYNNDQAKKIGAVGFLIEPGNLVSNNFNSGAQPIDLLPIGGTSPNDHPYAVAKAVNKYLQLLPTSPNFVINPPGGVEICLQSSSTDQSGLITIGGSGRQLVVKLDLHSDKTC